MNNLLIRVLVLGTPLLCLSQARAALPINTGDVFAATGGGAVQHYDSSLNLLETLNTGRGGFTTGMAFDAAGNLYVTDFSANSVSVFSKANTSLLPLFGSGYSTPESIVFNNSGQAYVGNVGGGIDKISPSGAHLAEVASGVRVDFLDLQPNQSTMLYTQEGREIKQWDVLADLALPDFAALPGSGNAFALRIRPNGEVLVADRGNVKRLNSAGAVIGSYDDPGNDSFFALNLSGDNTSFFSGDFSTGEILRFDIATGSVLDSVNTGSSQHFGLAVAGEITVGGPLTNTPDAGSTATLLGIGVLLLAGVRNRLNKK